MKDIVYSTNSEKLLFADMQNQVNALPNSVIGCQSMSDFAVKLGATNTFPVTLEIYGQPVIIAKDLITSNPKGPISSYKNSMLGSFTSPRATTPCSIMVNNGQVIFDQAVRAWAGYPEAVIYRLKNGMFGHGQFKYAKDLPKDVKWAIGGFGLLDMWNPSGQGFKKMMVNGKEVDYFSSVAYKTNHNVLGVKNGVVYGVYCKNMTAAEVERFCKNKMMFEFAIMLDGGGLAAINGNEPFAKININAKCGYMIQFI